MNTGKNKYIGFFVVLFVVFWFFSPLLSFEENKKNVSLFINDQTLKDDSLQSDFLNEISLKEIAADSYVIDISYVSLDNPSFIAIKDSNSRIIGASRLLPKGVSKDFSILLTESLKREVQYSIDIYEDDGNMTFSPAKDNFYLNGESNLASVSSFWPQ